MFDPAAHAAAEAAIISELKARGPMRVGFWLHGSTAELHDSCWGISGLHRSTLNLIGACHEVQLPVEFNTIVSRGTFTLSTL